MVSPWVVDRKCRAGIGEYYSHICSAVTAYNSTVESRVDKAAGMPFILADSPGDLLTDSEPIVLRL
jgi:hypothetical protein